jgi:hypothetical protein
MRAMVNLVVLHIENGTFGSHQCYSLVLYLGVLSVELQVSGGSSPLAHDLRTQAAGQKAKGQ